MSAPAYAELHCLSCFSFQRGASQAEELFKQAKLLGYSALAITDECSLAGIVRAHDAALEAGMKLIVGCELQIEEGPKLVLLVPDKCAYESMSTLITHARRRSRKGEYRVLLEDFTRHPQSALALWIPDAAASADHAAWVRDAFPQRAWIGVELHRGPGDRKRLAQLRRVGERFGLPLVASGDVRYHVRERRPLHDVMTATLHGLPISECGYRLLPNGERHLHRLDELQQLYPPDLLEQTVRIADRCTFGMKQIKYRYPGELVPAGHTPTSWLRELTQEGMRKRWPQGAKPSVVEQIEKELALIADLEYEAFFLTVWDIVREAKRLGILCQGRGSAANSASNP